MAENLVKAQQAKAVTQGQAPLQSIEVFSTSPISGSIDPDVYLENVIDVARWSEDAGCTGILVYTDNSQLDPWLVSQIVIQNTKALCPLVAVQPVYMHPYSVAKMVTSIAYLYGRRVYLNMVAGGFKNDLAALNDTTPHDLRYERLVEYTTIIKKLLASPAPVTFQGKFYRVENLSLKPSLPKELFPGVFVSGSSEAGVAAARAMGATAVKYPEPPAECKAQQITDDTPYGVRIGIIAREHDDSAWEVAHERFPEDRRGQITHQLAMKMSDSVWHKQLSRVSEGAKEKRDPYWLVPFQNYKTFCPYLVGSHKRVAEEVNRYVAAGYKAFILDIPPSKEELNHTNAVFKQATRTG